MKTFLNVGGGLRGNPVPAFTKGWKHDLLDIDPKTRPDVCMDARELKTLPAEKYDAIVCSHNLEHYYLHDAVKVVEGFFHVLKPEGFAYVVVPDLIAVIKYVAANNLDIDDVLYTSVVGPIKVRDVMYGYQKEIAASGSDFFAHKNAFSLKGLTDLFGALGFKHLIYSGQPFEIVTYIFKQEPGDEQKRELGLEKFCADSAERSAT